MQNTIASIQMRGRKHDKNPGHAQTVGVVPPPHLANT